MAFCKYCGKELTEATKFCPHCGASLDNVVFAEKSSDGAQQGTSYSQETDQTEIEKTRIACAVCYIPPLFFLPLVIHPDSRVGRFHANQALVLLIAWAILGIAAGIVGGLIWALPLIPSFMKTISTTLLDIAKNCAPFAAMVYGIACAAQGKMKEIPLIGKINIINK